MLGIDAHARGKYCICCYFPLDHDPNASVIYLANFGIVSLKWQLFLNITVHKKN
jgi:hypothetical protein